MTDLAVTSERIDQLLGERDIFRRSAEGAAVALAVEQPDALADFQPCHAGTDLIDDPRAIAVGDHARKAWAAIIAGAAIGVGRVDARGFEANAHLARNGLRRRHLAMSQDFGCRAGAIVPDGFHRLDPDRLG